MDKKYIRAYKYLCVTIFFLVALGGSVRAMNAGLACPDWPLCFGDIIPDYHPEVYFEFLHRALAGIVGIASAVLNILIIKNKNTTNNLKYMAFFALILLLAQIIMGGLTVLLQLHEKIVALHLGMGTGFLAISIWIYKTLQLEQINYKSEESRKVLVPSILLLISVFGQIILGGLVASHYAALVCVDFPLCHGKLFPTFSGIIGLQVIHRLGAYILTFVVAAYSIYVLRYTSDQKIKQITKILIAVFILQIVVGISNVLLLTPPLITVLHLALGALILSLATILLRLSSFKS